MLLPRLTGGICSPGGWLHGERGAAMRGGSGRPRQGRCTLSHRGGAFSREGDTACCGTCLGRVRTCSCCWGVA